MQTLFDVCADFTPPLIRIPTRQSLESSSTLRPFFGTYQQAKRQLESHHWFYDLSLYVQASLCDATGSNTQLIIRTISMTTLVQPLAQRS